MKLRLATGGCRNRHQTFYNAQKADKGIPNAAKPSHSSVRMGIGIKP